MQYRKTWLILLMVALMALWGCSDDDDDDPAPVNAFDTIANAMLEYVNDSADCPGTLSAVDLLDQLDVYEVIDIRGEGDYEAGHIEGAVHSGLATLLADITAQGWAQDQAICVTCYTGQTAGHAKIALELMGYENVKTLKFGMASWNHNLAFKWDDAIGDNLGTIDVVNNNDGLTEHEFPFLEGTVADKVNAMLAAGFQAKTLDDIVDNLDSYFIINYFGLADYMPNGTNGVPGHITGAFQFTPYASMGIDEMLGNIPTDQDVIVYCWTGQHSSQITAYLNMLGYTAYSLKFGTSHLFHTPIVDAKKWTADKTNDFDLVTGFTPSTTFVTIAETLEAYVNDSGCPGVVGASAYEDNIEAFNFLDIRSADDYNLGHIPGAINSTLEDVRTTVEAQGWGADAPIVVVCKTGQTAGHAKIALEMLGYENVESLGYGMCGWTASLSAPWDDQTFGEGTPQDPDGSGDTLGLIETDNNNGTLMWHDFGTVSDDATVSDQVDAMLADGFKAKTFESIEDNLENYFIINYFGLADYEGTNNDSGVPGHIPGAFQFTPRESMGWEQMLGNIPADQEVIVYCWTGQHSSQITAYLNMLGYDAYSLKFGVNHLFYNDLDQNYWEGNSTERPLDDVPTK